MAAFKRAVHPLGRAIHSTLPAPLEPVHADPAVSSQWTGTTKQLHEDTLALIAKGFDALREAGGWDLRINFPGLLLTDEDSEAPMGETLLG